MRSTYDRRGASPCRGGRFLSVLLATALLSVAVPAVGQESGGPGASSPAWPEGCDPAALRAAVEGLITEFPRRYPRGKDFLARLDAVEAAFSAASSDARRAEQAVAAFRALQREALIANPLVSEHPILFVVRRQYRPDHHNTATLFQVGEVNTSKFEGGSALATIDLAAGGRVETLLECPAGIIRDPEVHFDGNRIVFSMRRDRDDDYHLFEIQADGSGLRQLTFATPVADIDPLYLPDGGIAFSSTREPKFCMCNQHIMANLFRMDGDGANITQIGKSTLFEGHAALLPDGRILYDRWEYVDRNFGDAQGLWTVNPDGTNPAVFWGNNLNSPGAVIDARPIPGTEQTLCLFGSCHDRPWGALAIIDRRRGIDSRTAVVRTWPAAAIERVGKGNWDAFLSVHPKYEDPWPLSDEHFLASRMTGRGEEMGLYLIDVFGNELQLHAQAPGCYDPMPVGPRPRPHVLPERRDLAASHGRFFVADVYEGTHMQGVERGAVAWLRVVESPEKRTFTHTAWGGQGVQKPAMNWHDFNNKRVLGTVPVEEDGSAYFTVPADAFVYFQLLDADGMMVQSMRSGTMVQAGETAGCVGCHDDRRSAPPTRLYRTPLALQREPSRLEGWHGEARPFSYMAEVQPVFDRHCVGCHDYGEAAGAVLNLAADRTTTFNTSYNELWRKGYLAAIGAGPASTQRPRAWGSHESRLVAVLRDGHEAHAGVELSPREWDALVTWVDLNAPYYPHYECAFPANLAGRSPLNDEQTGRLSALTGVPFAELAGHAKNRGPQVSFDRPEMSPCLTSLREAAPEHYAEALAIVRAGAAALRTTPRADMAGFVPCAEHLRRERVYAARRRAEEQSRTALRRGEKAHDAR